MLNPFLSTKRSNICLNNSIFNIIGVVCIWESSMEKRVLFTFSLLASILLAVVAVNGCTSSKAEKEDLKSGLPENLDYKIDISGGTKGNITLTYADLKAMDFVKRLQVTYKDSAGNNKVSDFTGIKWNDVLEKGGVPVGEAYFKVYSPDGYNVSVYKRSGRQYDTCVQRKR